MKIYTEEYSASYRRVTIDNPPMNIFDSEMADEFQMLLTKLEADDAVKVVVFESINPDYFIAPASSVSEAEFAAEFEMKPGFAGEASFHYFLKRMEHSHFLTVGVLRGHAGGAGSEFLLGLDVRFASREKAVFSQIDPGTEFSNHPGGFESLCKLVGRARALEIILGSEDLDADTAERMGLINRSISDENLDAFIEQFASHISNFNRENIASAKRITDGQNRLAFMGDQNETQNNFFETSKWSETQERIASPFECDIHRRGDRELILGEQLRPDYVL